MTPVETPGRDLLSKKILLLDPMRLGREAYLCIPNIGLAYLATALRRNGFPPVILNAARDGIGPERAAEMASEDDFFAIGIPIYTPYFHSAARYAEALRKRFPNAVMVAGGPHPTFEPEETLSRIPEFDCVVQGEGEIALPALLKALVPGGPPVKESLKAVPNLVFRSNGGFFRTFRASIPDISNLDLPSWDLMRPDLFPLRVNGIFSKGRKVTPIVTSRGCPFPCAFCGVSRTMGKKPRYRKPDSVVEEIALLKNKYGIEEIHIEDDNFISVRESAMAVCEALIRSDLKIDWAIPPGIRLDQIDDELAALMRGAGCYLTSVGIESASQRILDLMKKNLRSEIIPEGVNTLRRNGIQVTGLFIFGYPGETIEEMKRTLDLALRLNLNRANFFNFTPFPGSEVHDKLKAEGSLDGLDYDEMYIHNINYCSPSIDPIQLQKTLRLAYLKFYIRPRILGDLVRQVRSLSQLSIIWRRGVKILFQTPPSTVVRAKGKAL